MQLSQLPARHDLRCRDYKVLVAADAISGVDARHLEEAGQIGVLHAETDEIVEALQPPELEVIS
ncbi:hypothetical protein RW1_048_00130 [Rhodococcus wratislaviensis NBRC 100605]|uniref:Isochorismatase-like domain-containing protein n=1 Tax=Rhodococcus wratislaviensis NBRC 100605 TaxID=1219028 RepID=X0PXD4_RHOWR|nr:hypothetical protein RW1_048_00130 [Rhodococcus wratislaviensis NBRC 100605]